MGWFRRIEQKIDHVIKQIEGVLNMSAHLDALTAQATAAVSAMNAASTAIAFAVSNILSLTSQLQAAISTSEDPTVIDKLTADLKTATDALVAATPVPPAPVTP